VPYLKDKKVKVAHLI